MVRALLDGTKTQTRRIVKPQPAGEMCFECIPPDYKNIVAILHSEKQFGCPYGQPGDRLWVRETWRIGAWNEDEGQVAVDYKACPVAKSPWIDVPDDGTRSMETFEHYWIQSTDDAMAAGMPIDEDGKYHWQAGESPCRWRPSIHMPRWASRITLEIINVRVERLLDISQKDVFAEGVKLPVDAETKAPLLRMTGKYPPSQYLTKETLSDEHAFCVAHYASLWESINGPGSWDANPWVWVIEFKRVQP